MGFNFGVNGALMGSRTLAIEHGLGEYERIILRIFVRTEKAVDASGIEFFGVRALVNS